MAVSLDPTLAKTGFQNWLRGALAVLFTKEGLTEFILAEITDFHKDLIHDVVTQNGIAPDTTCGLCTTANLLVCPTTNFCSKGKRCVNHDKIDLLKIPNRKCPAKDLCSVLRDGIRQQHRYNEPSWKNSDATKWCSDKFEVAKCFLPPDGYTGKTKLSDIDFNGMIAIIINNKRFQNKMTTPLSLPQNVCSAVRGIINENIRHSPTYELSDIQLARCIDALRDLLRDSKYLLKDRNAQDAVKKLDLLRNNNLVITAGDITKVLEENISEHISKQQEEAIEAIKDHLDNFQSVSVANLESIIDAKDKAIDDIQRKADAIQKKAEEIHKIVDEKVAQLGLNLATKTDEDYFNDLKEDLITNYRENESEIPAAPLVEEHNVPLEELYVLPPMWVYNNPYNFGPDKDAKDKKKTTFSEIFIDSENVRYRKIYITADAGSGKTLLSQKLTMTWCQAQKPLASLREKYDDAELDVMKYFHFLFLLHLRDFEGSNCNLDDLILHMVLENLSRNANYSKGFLQKLLHEKQCLVILDGLDEWVHPETCRKNPNAPHNNHPDSCTVITTSRPWKLGTIRSSPKHIDRHVEISELDSETGAQLQSNAMSILNEKGLNKSGKDISNFNEEVGKVEIGAILLIPYIHLQLICLFFGGLPLGQSKCEIYSNIIELTLERGLNRANVPDIPLHSNDNTVIPKFMKKNMKSNRYISLIMKLGKLALFTLFDMKEESTLIFDLNVVQEYMTVQEIDFCLKVGLLCQTKDSSIIAARRFKVFFQHKSLQEFFAAVYITSEWVNESVKSTVLEKCFCIYTILEMSNVFVFVCGMKPDVYKCISEELQKIVECDKHICCYRTNYEVEFNFATEILLYSYQSMQVKCFQESVRNEHEFYQIRLHDVLLDTRLTGDSCTALKTIIQFNEDKVKSIKLSLTRDVDDIKKADLMKCLVPVVFRSLEAFRATGALDQVFQADNQEHQAWLADIFTASARSLTYLELEIDDSPAVFSLADINITELTGLTFLHTLRLVNVTMTRSNIERLYAYIGHTATLKRVKLHEIKCCDHENIYQGCINVLDLQNLGELIQLDVEDIPNSDIKVPECLESLSIRDVIMTHGGLECLYTDISQATTLTELKFKTIKCSDHENKHHDCVFVLDLERLDKLIMLDVKDIPNRDIKVPVRLESLSISNINMRHRGLECLYADISRATKLTKLKLKNIHCSNCNSQLPEDRDHISEDENQCSDLSDRDHESQLSDDGDHFSEQKNQCSEQSDQKQEGQYHGCILALNLYNLNKLENLYIKSVTCNKLRVSTANLKSVTILPRSKMSANDSASLWTDLREAPAISSLEIGKQESCQEMIQTIPTLTQLFSISLDSIEMGDRIMRFSPEMKQLENVTLSGITMTSAWTELFLSAGELPRLSVISLFDIDMDDGILRFSSAMTNLKDVQLISVRMSFAALKELFHSIGELPQLSVLRLGSINMGDAVLRFSSAMTNLKHVCLFYVNMSFAAWKELFLSIGELPQRIEVNLLAIIMKAKEWRELFLGFGEVHVPHGITFDLSGIKMTAQEWREFIFIVRRLPESVILKLSLCFGATTEEWKALVQEIKSTPTLSVINDLRLSSGTDIVWAYLTLKSKTV